jgi:hypothetical protein
MLLFSDGETDLELDVAIDAGTETSEGIQFE